MIKIYNTNKETNISEKIENIEKGCWINLTNPTEVEIKDICQKVNLQEEFVRYSLDSDEKARIDIDEDENTILFIIDVPILEMENEREVYTTMPIGIIVVRDEYIVTVALKESKVMWDLEENLKNLSTYKKSRMILKLFYLNSKRYLDLLNGISREISSTERLLKKSFKNNELLKMLDLDKSLVYFTTSLKSNELVMEKTLRGKIIKLYEEDEEILDDIIIENNQAIDMSKLYSNILNKTMETYSSIISNNLNLAMKVLTSITIVLSIPTLIASLWGMNVPVPFQRNENGFIIITIISIITTAIIVYILKKKDMLD